ncbi:hypothetical protein Tco_1466498 [Tanacetum coccineum]
MAYIIRQVKSSSTVKMNPESIEKNDPKDVQLQDEDIMYDIDLYFVKDEMGIDDSLSHSDTFLFAPSSIKDATRLCFSQVTISPRGWKRKDAVISANILSLSRTLDLVEKCYENY